MLRGIVAALLGEFFNALCKFRLDILIALALRMRRVVLCLPGRAGFIFVALRISLFGQKLILGSFFRVFFVLGRAFRAVVRHAPRIVVLMPPCLQYFTVVFGVVGSPGYRVYAA